MGTIITISRQYGSGGRIVAQLVAKQLCYQFYDKALIDRAAEESGFSTHHITESGEYATSSSSLLFGLSVANTMGQGGMSLYDNVYLAQSKVIRAIADSEENAVIVGRCADYILRERAHCLHVFLHADAQSRLRRAVEEYGEAEAKSEKFLREKDKRRKVYYRTYTGENWGEAQNYHLTLDTGLLGIETCADLITRAVQAMQ